MHNDNFDVVEMRGGGNERGIYNRPSKNLVLFI